MPYCSYCGNQISDQAVACPNCGHPVGVPAAPSPAPTAAGGAYAGFWRRAGALLVDVIVVSIVTLPFAEPTFLFTDEGFSDGRVRGFRTAISWPSIGLSFLYHWLMLSFVKGQTLGKMLLGIRITAPDGSLIDVGRAAARQAMAIVSGFALGLGYLWAAWDSENRTWHDMVADTRAFRVR